jgi:hypothetical protein
MWLSMRFGGPEKVRICASDKCRRTPAAAGWPRGRAAGWPQARAAAGIQPVFSELAGGDW